MSKCIDGLINVDKFEEFGRRMEIIFENRQSITLCIKALKINES